MLRIINLFLLYNIHILFRIFVTTFMIEFDLWFFFCMLKYIYNRFYNHALMWHIPYGCKLFGSKIHVLFSLIFILSFRLPITCKKRYSKKLKKWYNLDASPLRSLGLDCFYICPSTHKGSLFPNPMTCWTSLSVSPLSFFNYVQ